MKRNWYLVLGVIFFGVLIVYRAREIPMTHDEASTWLNYKHLNVWSCLTNSACWGSANNHWLNTLLLQWSSGIGGDTPLAIRFPNVIAGIAYLICSSLICSRYLSGGLTRFAGVILLVGHVYLLDFFSLARGYGLMTCGVIWGIYFLLRYLEIPGRRWLLGSIIAFMFACLSNFTALLVWSAACLSWSLWMVIQRKYSLLVRHSIYWIVSALLLWLLLRFPIRLISAIGDFDYGSDNIWAMLKDLVRNLLYGHLYWGKTSLILFTGLIIFLILSVAGAALLQKRYLFRRQILFWGLLLIINFLVIVLQQKISGSHAPEGRRSIYFIPLIFGFLALGLGLIKNNWFRIVVSFFASVIIMLHMFYVLPLRNCREWYFDAYYPELFSTILPKGSASDSIRLGTSWIFNPALSFYQKTTPLPISGLVYQRPLAIDSAMQYYYIETQDSVGMAVNGFVLEKKIGPFLLFKRPGHFDSAQ